MQDTRKMQHAPAPCNAHRAPCSMKLRRARDIQHARCIEICSHTQRATEVCNTQQAACSLQDAPCGMRHAAARCSLQHATSNLRHATRTNMLRGGRGVHDAQATRSAQHATRGDKVREDCNVQRQRPPCRMPHATRSMQRAACSTHQCRNSDVWLQDATCNMQQPEQRNTEESQHQTGGLLCA